MARIVIEINDLVADNIEKKITAIDTAAKFAHVNVGLLADALDRVTGRKVKDLATSFDATQKVIAKNAIQVAKLDNEQTKLAITQSRLELQEERLRQATEKGNFARQKRISTLQSEIVSVNSLLGVNRQLEIQESAKSRLSPTGRVGSASSALRGLGGANVEASTAVSRAAQLEAARLNVLKDRYVSLDGSIKKTTGSLFTFHNLFVAFALIRIADKIIDITDAYTLMENRLKLVATSTGNAVELQRRMFKIANETRVPVRELTQSFVRYDFALKTLGASQQESIRFTTTLTKQLAISGLTAQEQSASMLQLSQALNKGKLDGDEFRTVMETLPTVATAIAREMGVARGELIELAPQGKITAEVIRAAMASIADDTDKAFKGLSITVGQSLTIATTNIIRDVGILNKNIGVSGLLAKGIIATSKHLDSLAIAITTVSTAMLLRLVPSTAITIASLKALSIATLKLVAPILLAVAAYEGLKFAILGNIAAQDAETDANNKKADEFERKRAIIAKSLIFESEEVLKTRESYIKYQEVLKEVEKGLALKSITQTTAQIILQQTEIGKLQQKTKELLEFKPSSEETEVEKLKKETEDINDIFNKQIANLEISLLAKKEIKEKARIESDKAIRKQQNETRKILEEQEKFFPGSSDRGVFDELNADKISEFRSVKNEKFKLFEKENASTELLIKTISDLNKKREESINILKEEFSVKKSEQLDKEILKLTTDKFELERELVRGITLERLKGLDEQQAKGIITSEMAREQNRKIGLSASLQIEKINKEEIQSIEDIAEAKDKALKDSLNKEEKERRRIEKDTLKAIEREKELRDNITDITRRVSPERTPQEKILDNSADRLKIINDLESEKIAAISRDIENTKKGEEEKQKIIDEFNLIRKLNSQKTEKEIADNKSAILLQDVKNVAATFGALSNLAANFADGEKKSAKIAFGISQALALAEAIVNTAAAIAEANKSDIFSKGPQIALAASIGAAQIATITSATIKGFAQGGVDIGGKGTGTSDSMLARISKGESIITAQGTAKNKGVLQDINANRPISTTSNNSNTSMPSITIINNSGQKITQRPVFDRDSNELKLILEAVDVDQAQKFADGNGRHAKVVREKMKAGY